MAPRKQIIRLPGDNVRRKAAKRRIERQDSVHSFVNDDQIAERSVRADVSAAMSFCGWSSDDLRTTPHLVAAIQDEQARIDFREYPFRQGQLIKLIRLLIAESAYLAYGLARPELKRSRPDVALVAKSLKRARASLAAALSSNIDTPDLKPAITTVERLCAEIEQAETALPKGHRVKPEGGRNELLAEYVRQVEFRWSSVFNPPPKSASGPYQRILTAGWRDLKWPDHDIGDRLGEMIGNAIVKRRKIQ